MPSAASDRTDDQIWDRLRGSRPVVGSSRNRTAGVTIRLATRSSRRLHPAGPRLHQAAARVGQAEALEQLRGPRLRAAPAQVLHQPEDEQVLPAGEVVVNGRVLARQADGRAYLPRLAHDVVAGDQGGAAVGPDQRGQHADGGGLARAVRAEQRADAALGHRQVHPAQRLDLAERFPQACCLDRHHRSASLHPLDLNYVHSTTYLVRS